MKDDQVYLQHILDAIRQIESYVGGHSRDEFLKTRLVQDAVVRELEIVGEASRHISEDCKEKNDYIPWDAIIGMRNRIAHEYVNIDLYVIWEIVFQDLPLLKDQVGRLVP